MNKIILITTKGCEGCAIARENIKSALTQTRKKISFEVRDVSEVTKKYIRTFGIRDFPAILFFSNEELKVKKEGSVPTVVILRWIDIHFK